MSPPSRTSDIRRVAADTYDWPDLRPGQLEAMAAVVAGRDTLVVMPTGSGRSAVYQVPALLMHGPTVVVSPLIALQRDQVSALLARGDATGGAVAANSTQGERERRESLDAVGAGETEFVFLAPEQLAKPDVVYRLKRARPSLFVVDEAHCVSSWGHDFRPDYLRLGEVAEQLGRPPILALTATAAPPVRAEIVERLGMRDPAEVVRGYHRSNLFLEVVTAADEADKRDAVVVRAATEEKPGIVYTATRRDTERYAEALRELGLSAEPYHSGLRVRQRQETHERFLDDGLDVVVATSAFGMGIDKPNVRFVLHAAVPDSVDSYYQEVGRVGRDGRPAAGVLFYRPEDLGLRRFFASFSPDPLLLQKLVTLVRHAPGPVPLAQLGKEAEVSRNRLTRAVNLLQQVGAVTVEKGRVVPVLDGWPPQEAAQQAVELADAHERVNRSRVEMMRGYAESTGCRWQFLLGYFGEYLSHVCGHCDSCRDGTAEQSPDPGESPFPLGAQVEHTEWGRGEVMSFEGDRIVVLFDSVGYRTLSLPAILGNDLLELR
jgi:ATP-dependent DNA helicase RecQ